MDQREFFKNAILLNRAGTVFRNCRVLEFVFDGQLDPDNRIQYLLKNPLFNVLARAVHLRDLYQVYGKREDASAILKTVRGR